jgi:hypothetical protein
MSLVRITGGRPLAGGGSLDYVEDKPLREPVVDVDRP